MGSMGARARAARWGAALAVVVTVAACGGGTAGDDAAGEHAHGEQDHAHGEQGHGHGEDAGEAAAVGFGAPAPAGEASREVPIVASDPFEFSPVSVEVKVGEVVSFVVVNEGKAVHEFVLGDHAYQDAHAEEMAAGGHHHGAEGNAVTVAPGEEATLTWRFTRAGEYLFACHQPGHYVGGMVGTLVVEG